MDFHHLSLIASDITAKLEQQQKELDLEDWPISLHKPNLIHWTDNSSSLNTDDNFRSGCQNLSHCNWRQFFSGIPPLDIQTSLSYFHYCKKCAKHCSLVYLRKNNYIKAKVEGDWEVMCDSVFDNALLHVHHDMRA